MKTMREKMMDYFSKTNQGFQTLTGFDFLKQKPLIRSKAIRAKCLECQGAQQAEVFRCQITDCPLWPYRMCRKLTEKDMVLWREQAASAETGD